MTYETERQNKLERQELESRIPSLETYLNYMNLTYWFIHNPRGQGVPPSYKSYNPGDIQTYELIGYERSEQK